MTTREIRGMRRLPLPALLLLPLLGAPVFAMIGDDYGSPYTSAGEIRAAQKILQGEQYLKAGRYEAGRMDQGTIDAVRAFQRSHFIPNSGLLDRETFAQLTSHGSTVVAGRRTETSSGAPANRGEDTTAAAPAGARGRDVSRTTPGEGQSGLRSMPATAGPVPLMTALGAVLLGGGLLLARRRRA
jgi:LPXTG-motif cell wall-anchored protein